MAKVEKEIAEAIKDHLIQLAVNDNLPLDMTQLPIEGLEKIVFNVITKNK